MANESKPKDEAPAAPKVDAFAAIGNFKPKVTEIKPGVTEDIKKDLDKVATDNGFLSREAKPSTKAKAATTTRRFNAAEPKRQLNIKIPIPMHDRYYEMAKERGISKLHELLGMALDALEAQDKKGK